MPPNELRFDSILPVEVPVYFGNEKYVLKEPPGPLSNEYKKSISAFATVIDGKVTVMNPKEALAGNQEASEKLLADCLYDPKGAQVGVEFVKSLPGRISDQLIETVLGLTGIDLKKPEEEKSLKNS